MEIGLRECVELQVFNTLFKEINFTMEKDKLVEINYKVLCKKIDKITENDILHILQVLKDTALLDEYTVSNRIFVGISYKGINYAFDKGYLELGQFCVKINEINTSISESRSRIENTENRINSVLKEIVKHEEKISVQSKETESIRNKLIETMGLFVAVFALIGINVNSMSILSNLNNIKDKLIFIFSINGTIIFSILTILLGIKIIIFHEKIESKKQIAIFILPVIFLCLSGFIAIF